MFATVRWTALDNEGTHPLWLAIRGLYAYVGPKNEVLYVGKVDGTTVRQRWNRSGKEAFWNDLERERNIFKHAAIFGAIELGMGSRLTRELLADIESLLIKRVQPWGNIQSRNMRIARPGLHVRCAGSWPLQKSQFYDPG
jgi:hypothetical protein